MGARRSHSSPAVPSCHRVSGDNSWASSNRGTTFPSPTSPLSWTSTSDRDRRGRRPRCLRVAQMFSSAAILIVKRILLAFVELGRTQLFKALFAPFVSLCLFSFASLICFSRAKEIFRAIVEHHRISESQSIIEHHKTIIDNHRTS